jgi:uncharacterized circularly permuted ATP-grasp superfamily protein
LDAANAFNRLVAQDEGTALAQAEWLDAEYRRRGLSFGAEPMRSFLRPHFIERAAWQQLRSNGHRLLEIAARTARRAFRGDALHLLAWLGTPETHSRWVRLDPGEPDVVLSRLDAFLTPEGPRFIEVNSDAPAGFGYGDRMAEVVAQLRIFREFAEHTPVSYQPSGPRLVEAVVHAWVDHGGSGFPSIAIADWADVKTRADQEILREAFEARGFESFLADPRDSAVLGGELFMGGRRVDIVYRRAVLAELVEREPDVRVFLEAYRDSAAFFVNSLRCHLSEDKAFLALLTDEAFADLLSEEERHFVTGVVPWSRKVEERHTQKGGAVVDLVPFILAKRESLVLKPSHGYGGRSVFVGDETEPAAWEAAVLGALGSAWIVQERVTIPEEPFPVFDGGVLRFEALKVNASPFYVAGAEVGAVTRASRSSVINVSAGGGSVPTFVVG